MDTYTFKLRTEFSSTSGSMFISLQSVSANYIVFSFNKIEVYLVIIVPGTQNINLFTHMYMPKYYNSFLKNAHFDSFHLFVSTFQKFHSCTVGVFLLNGWTLLCHPGNWLYMVCYTSPFKFILGNMLALMPIWMELCWSHTFQMVL